MLEADLSLSVGALALEVALTVGDGEIVALLGPNGAGKTTTLRAIAGLTPIARGSIVLDGVALDTPAAGVFVPAHRRPIGVVFQDYLLFPSMSVLDNVAFGLRSTGMRRSESRRAARRWLERFGMAEQAFRRPQTLSGGQAQRVALARALATEPKLLLLDEPLAALDAQQRTAVRAVLRHDLDSLGGARLLVTHDPLDAVVLADRLVIVEDGRVTQSGPTPEVVARPRTRYIADLVGINLLVGTTVEPHTAQLSSGAEVTTADPLPAGEVAIAVRPQAVALHRERPAGSPRNAWRLRVASLEGDRDRIRVRLAGALELTAEVTPAAVADLGLQAGDEVWAAIKAVDVAAYPR